MHILNQARRVGDSGLSAPSRRFRLAAAADRPRGLVVRVSTGEHFRRAPLATLNFAFSRAPGRIWSAGAAIVLGPGRPICGRLGRALLPLAACIALLPVAESAEPAGDPFAAGKLRHS